MMFLMTKLYNLFQDMRHIETEFHNIQKYTIGIVKGINQDYM